MNSPRGRARLDHGAAGAEKERLTREADFAFRQALALDVANTFDRYQPDLVVLGKPMGNGLPLAATAASKAGFAASESRYAVVEPSNEPIVPFWIAETGVKDAFRIAHELIRMNQNVAKVIQLRGNWVPINPQEWRKRDHLTAAVGLGTGDTTNRLQHLQMITTVQHSVMQLGLANPSTMYEGLMEFTKAAGFKDGAKFWIKPAPGAPPPAPPPDPKIMVKMQELQFKQQQLQAEMATADKDRQAQIQRHLDTLKADYDRAFLQAQTQLASSALTVSAERGAVKSQVASSMGVQTDDQAHLDQQATQAQAIKSLAESVQALHQQVSVLAKPRPKSVRHVYDGSGRIVQSVAEDQMPMMMDPNAIPNAQ